METNDRRSCGECQDPSPSRPGALVNDRPEHAEPVTQLAEPRREEGFLQWRNVIPGQHRIANVDPCVDNHLARVTRGTRCLTLLHHHDDLAAEMLFIEAKCFLAIAAEVELRK